MSSRAVVTSDISEIPHPALSTAGYAGLRMVQPGPRVLDPARVLVLESVEAAAVLDRVAKHRGVGEVIPRAPSQILGDVAVVGHRIQLGLESGPRHIRADVPQ